MSTFIEMVWRELTQATRAMRREPALVIGVVLTLALAIGANAAMFGLVRRLMLPAPPGVADPARVARVSLNLLSEDGEPYSASTMSYPAFKALDDRADIFAAVAAVQTRTTTMGRGADAIAVTSIAASGRYFEVLGARAAGGRIFSREDDALPAGTPVVVLSHPFWKRQFGGDAGVLGREVVLDDQSYTVIGVAPPDFSGDALGVVDVFVPLTVALRSRGPGWWNDPRINLISIIARVRDGVSHAEAAAAATVSIEAVQSYGVGTRVAAVLEPLLPSATRSSPQARIALWALGVALIVLLIATANVGTLLLLRAIRRRRELAVRMALGAGRLRLAALLTVESLVLSVAGGALGLLISHWLAEVIRATLLPALAPSDRIADPKLLLVTAALSVAAGLLAGVVPLFLLSPERLSAELHGSGIAGTVGRSRAQRALIGVQVALCTVLLVGAGLFIRSLHRVQTQELGFSTDRLLYVTLDFPTHVPARQSDDLHRDAVRHLADVRGVDLASVAQAIPFGPHHIPPISVPGLAEPPSANGQLPLLYGATPAYLDLLDVKLVQGRLLTDADGPGSALVVLVNETMAREVWPDQSAIGRCIRIGFDPTLPPTPLAPASLPCRQVVGVVRDSRARSLRPTGREASLMQYYVPFGQIPEPPFADATSISGILVRTVGEPQRMMTVVQRRVQESLGVPGRARAQRYQDLLDPQLRSWRMGATLFTAFGILALGIASVGLWGVISYLVAQRRREIGIRLALGGTSGMIGWSVVMTALRMVAVGIGAGVVVALLAGPGLQSMLFDTSARDVGVLAGAASALMLVAIASAAVPAWRAARVSPMTALRVEQ